MRRRIHNLNVGIAVALIVVSAPAIWIEFK
jgi:hypothetical protein